MRGTHVHSNDPLKSVIVVLLKQRTGASRVTAVRQISPGVFEGTCLAERQGNGNYKKLGRFTVSLTAAPGESL